MAQAAPRDAPEATPVRSGENGLVHRAGKAHRSSGHHTHYHPGKAQLPEHPGLHGISGLTQKDPPDFPWRKGIAAHAGGQRSQACQKQKPSQKHAFFHRFHLVISPVSKVKP